MLPLVFLPTTPVLLAGRGPAFAKRRALLEGAGIAALALHEGVPEAAALDGMRLAFAAGLDPAESQAFAATARGHGIPVNVEDVPELCDFHVPALVRRGDLLLTVSTAGTAPALAATLRARLEEAFGAEWTDRLNDVGALRARLRAAGATPQEVMRAVRAHVAAEGWFDAAPSDARTKSEGVEIRA